MPALVNLAPAAVALLVALVSELRSGDIPNVLTLPLVPLGFLICLRDARWIERGIALAGGLMVFAR